MPAKYQLVDGKTGRILRVYQTRKGAQRAADRQDQLYGAYRYTVVPIWANATNAPAGYAYKPV